MEEQIPDEVVKAAEQEMVVTSYIQEANQAIEEKGKEVGYLDPRETAQLIADAFNKHSLERGEKDLRADVEEETAGELYSIYTTSKSSPTNIKSNHIVAFYIRQ